MKKCSKCKKLKTEAEYPSNGSGRRRPECKTCKGKFDRAYYKTHRSEVAAYMQRYRAENSEEIKRKRRLHYAANCEQIKAKQRNYAKKNQRRLELKRRFGLSLADYHKLYTDQRGRCAICQKELIKPHVDHNHQTGMVRGLLCGKCNCGIGQLQDSTVILRQAIDYLERSQ